MSAPSAVRWCWVLGLALAAGALALRAVPVKPERSLQPVEPLSLPDVEQLDASHMRYGESGVRVGGRNPFDPQGARWAARREKPEPERSPAPRRGAPGGIQGVFKIPGVEGVFVKDRFVTRGETVQGARVREVEQGEIVFSLDGERTATWVDGERKERLETFQQLGLPLREAQ